MSYFYNRSYQKKFNEQIFNVEISNLFLPRISSISKKNIYMNNLSILLKELIQNKAYYLLKNEGLIKIQQNFYHHVLPFREEAIRTPENSGTSGNFRCCTIHVDKFRTIFNGASIGLGSISCLIMPKIGAQCVYYQSLAH